MRDEREDPVGFARRATLALFQVHLRRQVGFAEVAEKRLGRVAEALVAAG